MTPIAWKLILIAQAVLIWMIVFSAAFPFKKPPKLISIAIVVITTIAAIIEVTLFDGKLLLLTAALAGYGWGGLMKNMMDKQIKKKEKKILDE